MADITDIQISFAAEEQAAEAERIAKGMIRLDCAADAPNPPEWAGEVKACASLSEAYDRFQTQAEAYDPLPDFPYCCMQRVHHSGSELFIDRCGDMVRAFLLTDRRAFLPQLCATLARRFPGAHFTAFCRYEMTVSDVVTETVLHCDGTRFQVREQCIIEDEPDAESHETYALAPDGTLKRV